MHELLINCLFVGCGGAIGSALRYLFGFIPLPAVSGFPLTTFLVNLIGSFVIGLIVGCISSYGSIDQHLRLFLQVGICGGFTTLSTFSLETTGLLQSGSTAMAFAYVAATVIICVAGTFAAQMLVGRIAS